MMSEEMKKLVLDKRKEGKVVYWALPDELCSAVTSEFIKQPVDGILWDLNRSEEVALSFMDDPKWVNDFAVALTIRELKSRIDQLEKELGGCRKLAKSYIDEYEKLAFSDAIDEMRKKNNINE